MCYNSPMANLKVGTGASNGYSPGGYWKEARLARIDLENDENINFWCVELNIPRDRLLVAVKDYGPVIRDIRRGLDAEKADQAA